MNSPTDEHLMTLFRDGDRQALRTLFERYKDRLFRFIYGAYLHERTQAEDCVQDVFLRIIHSAKSFQNGRRFQPWIYTIARNAALNMVRDSSRRASWLTFDAGTPQEDSCQATANEQLSKRELHELVIKSVQKLPENLRQVFVLREIEGLSYDEISDMLGMSEGNLRTTVHRARKKLQDALKPYLEE